MPGRIVSFIMSGGVGSRLWPLSREDNPKQSTDDSSATKPAAPKAGDSR